MTILIIIVDYYLCSCGVINCGLDGDTLWCVEHDSNCTNSVLQLHTLLDHDNIELRT